ncbi:MAG TPA: hypothetical protein PLO89_04130 [Spirochaetota bacterium]|nr:hypothetical protein [Spirochaetota bacterium]
MKEILGEADFFFNNFNLIFFSDVNQKEFLLYDEKNDFSILFEGDLKEVFLFIVKNYFGNKKNDIKFSYEILSLSEEIIPEKDEKFLFKIFSLIGWQGYKKGLDYYETLKKMESTLKTKILDKKISIVEGVLFHNYFQKDYSFFIDKLPKDASFSENNQIIRYLTEVCKKKDLKLSDVDKKIDFSSEKNIINSLFNLKYPNYSGIKKRFEKFILDFDFPSGVKIDYDHTFEKEEYSLEISFNSIESLSKKIAKIKKNLDKSILLNENDFFIQENLFKENKNER